MQILREKACEIWSHAVTSGRQRVDKQGAVPDINNSCFMLDQPWRHEQWYWHYLANALASSPPTDSTRKKELQDFVRHCPLCVYRVSTLCLIEVTACDWISQAHVWFVGEVVSLYFLLPSLLGKPAFSWMGMKVKKLDTMHPLRDTLVSLKLNTS